MLACAILVVAIAYTLVRIVYLFVDSSVGPAPEIYGSERASGVPVSRSAPKVDTSAIAVWSLFGKEGAKPEEKISPKDVDAPETRLNLELQAVFVAPVEENSTAMIAETRKDSLLYHIGDKVPGNATLEAVYSDRVLLNRSGMLEALYFPQNSDSPAMTRSTSRSRASQAGLRNTQNRTAVSNSRTSFGARPGGGGMSPSDMQAAMTGQMIGALREQVNEDPGQVLGQLGLVSNNGRGYVVSEGANPMLAAAGARPGDVILAVNGQPIGDPMQDVNLIESVMNDGSIRVSLERNGRAFESEFQIPGR